MGRKNEGSQSQSVAAALATAPGIHVSLSRIAAIRLAFASEEERAKLNVPQELQTAFFALADALGQTADMASEDGQSYGIVIEVKGQNDDDYFKAQNDEIDYEGGDFTSVTTLPPDEEQMEAILDRIFGGDDLDDDSDAEDEDEMRRLAAE